MGGCGRLRLINSSVPGGDTDCLVWLVWISLLDVASARFQVLLSRPRAAIRSRNKLNSSLEARLESMLVDERPNGRWGASGRAALIADVVVQKSLGVHPVKRTTLHSGSLSALSLS